MKRFSIFLSFTFCVLVSFAQDALHIYPSEVQFGNVLPGNSSVCTVEVRNTSSESQNFSVVVTQENSALTLLSDVNAPEGVYNLYPGETVSLRFKYMPSAESDDDTALFEAKVMDSDETHVITVKGTSIDTRTLRLLRKDGTYKDFDHVGEISTTPEKQTISLNGEECAIPLAEIDSIVFMLVSENFTPTVSQRGYSDTSGGITVEMRDDVIYICQDVEDDILMIDETNRIVTIRDSEAVRKLGISIGDVLYSSKSTERFPNGYAIRIVDYVNESKAKSVGYKSNVDSSIKDNMFVFDPAGSNDVFKHLHGSTYGPGYVLPYCSQEKMKAASPDRQSNKLNIEADLSSILEPLLKKKWDAIPSLEYKMNPEKHTIEGSCSFSGHKAAFKLKYDESDEELETVNVSFDKHDWTVDINNMLVTYKYTLSDLKEAKATGKKLTVDFTLGCRLDFDFNINWESSHVDVVGKGVIYPKFITGIEYSIDPNKWLVNKDETLSETDKKAINEVLGGDACLHFCGTVLIPNGLDKIVSPKLGAWVFVQLEPSGKARAELGIDDGKYEFDLDASIYYNSWSKTHFKSSGIQTVSPMRPVLSFTGKFENKLKLWADMGFQLDLPKVKYGTEGYEKTSHVGVYVTPTFEGSFSTITNMDPILGKLQEEFKISGELYVDGKVKCNLGYKDWGKVEDQLTKRLFPLDKDSWSFEKTWNLQSSSDYLVNSSPANDECISIKVGQAKPISFQWKTMRRENLVSYDSYEVYLGTTDDPNDMDKIATVKSFDGVNVPKYFLHNQSLTSGKYYWYVKGNISKDNYVCSEITSFNVCMPTLEVSHKTLDFGKISLGESKTLIVTITNTGKESATFKAEKHDDFSFNIREEGMAIEPGKSFVLQVTYTPSSMPTTSPILKLTSLAFEDGYELIYTDAIVTDTPSYGSHEYVDLGLSSGTLWATCNVGANSPEEYGDYFAWGETKPKSNYSWSTYFDTTDGGKTFGKYNYDGKKTLDPEDDAAFTNWGENWRMPTANEFEELRTSCTWTWNSSKKGYDVVGPNKKAIFIPATGHILNGSGNSVGQTGNYWVSSLDDGKSNLSVDFHFSSSAVDWNYDDRYHGHSIRPVYNKKQEPQTGTHEYVDLGLSVKWATCNVGANSPEEYGDYFAWGETKPKDYYDWSTYKWCNGSYDTQTKYCTSSSYGTVDNKTTLELADDAAYKNWSGSWRMPTKAEQDELREKCTWTWTAQNGINGYKVTSKTNGNSIFLPAAGCRYDSSLYIAGSGGCFWSSSLRSASRTTRAASTSFRAVSVGTTTTAATAVFLSALCARRVRIYLIPLIP